MLCSLSIRDVVIIERLDIVFERGLSVLTGETGAGKSILLDALGLALGERSHRRLVRPGAARAVVTAEFIIDSHHPALELLAEQGFEHESRLVLRRILENDGQSRAFINDQPVSAGFLKKIGESFIEIHGQFDRLLDPASHRSFLDGYARLEVMRLEVASFYTGWQTALKAYQDAGYAATHRRANEDLLRHNLEELKAIQPRKGEEEELAQKRTFLSHSAKLVETLQAAFDLLSGDRGAGRQLNAAYRLLEKANGMSSDRLTPILETLDRAATEATESLALIQGMLAEIPEGVTHLDVLEERLFNLRTLARKHGCLPDELSDLKEKYQAEFDNLEHDEERFKGLKQELQAIRKSYYKTAQELGRARRAAAVTLDKRVLAELPPLKMDRAKFRTNLQEAPETQWGPDGIDKVEFEIAANAGMPFGGLGVVASGGERARLMLALKVILAQAGTVSTLIFDEIDSGVGGAVAHAVGERLARLGENLQVLVITHSPQVASMASHHWRVEKKPQDQGVKTEVVRLDPHQRREEVARMLSGDKVTEEARAAADQLIIERVAG